MRFWHYCNCGQKPGQRSLLIDPVHNAGGWRNVEACRSRIAISAQLTRWSDLNAEVFRMATLSTHTTFLHQAALPRIFFHHGLKRATRPLQRATILSPLRARPLSNHVVTPRRMTAAFVTGLACTGLGLTFYANFQRLNCERESIILPDQELWLKTGEAEGRSSQLHSKATLESSDPMADPPPPESIVNMYELTFGTVCGVCAGVFVKKGAKALAFVFGGIFVLLQVSSLQYHTGWSFSHANPQIVSQQHVDNKDRLGQSRSSL
jgi:hypothetical protein